MNVLSEETFDLSPRQTEIASRLRSATLVEILRARADHFLSPLRATVVSLVLLAVASWGDMVTTAEATFTLFYVVPLSIAVWYATIRVGYLIALLSVISGAAIDLYVGPRPSSWFFLGWNKLIDAGLFISFAHILAALRARVNLESELRMDALNQLRHAERLTTIGKLASGIAHEIGTPLNVISGHAELMVMGRLDTEEVKRSGQVLLEQSKRVTTIVHQLLDFARRGGTRVMLTDINDLAVATTRLLESLAGKSGIEIVTQGTPVKADVNRSEIQQVLTNLITNAIHAMPNGGRIEVDVREEHTRAPEEKHGSRQDYVVLSVRDFGTGIALGVLPKIFDPFFTTKDVGQGTGLGLSVAYGIVRDHNGWVNVNTRLGEGTTFSVYLPQESTKTSRHADH
jgi:signal transduction histidine kinase